MPLSSHRLKWFCNTAFRTRDFLPLLFTNDQKVKSISLPGSAALSGGQ